MRWVRGENGGAVEAKGVFEFGPKTTFTSTSLKRSVLISNM